MFNPFVYFNPVSRKLTKRSDLSVKPDFSLGKQKQNRMEAQTVPQNQYGGHIGQTGCLFLSLIYLVKPTLLVSANIPLVNAIYHESIARGFIRKDCFVNDRDSFLKYLEKEFHVKRNLNFDISKNLVRYSNSYDHFVVVRKNTTEIMYDPMKSSVIWLGGK